MNNNPLQLPDAFSKRYPITQRPNESGGIDTTVFIFDEIGAPQEFAEIIDILDNSIKEDLIIFKLNTPGGRLDSSLSIRDAIFASAANTVAECSGGVASAGTFLALACDGLYVAPHTEFMCHYYSGGLGGKGNEIEAASKFGAVHHPAINYDVYKKFLTKKEIKRLIQGKDYYFNIEQTKERWAKVVEYRQKQHDKGMEEAEKEQVASMIDELSERGFNVTKD